MIFTTIGTQQPFDRLIKIIDQLASEMTDVEFVTQSIEGSYKPKYIKTFGFLSPSEFDHYFSKAQLIISHAGMGTIISAMVSEKPIIVMPRLFSYKEHRSDHQLATAKAFGELKFVNTAYNEIELREKISAIMHNPNSLHKIGSYASEHLISDIKNFINSNNYIL